MYREVFVKSYRVVYLVEATGILVVDIFHSHQDVDLLATLGLDPPE